MEVREAYIYQGWKQDTDPIYLRAWTYQEHTLSHRVLFYRSSLLEWRCRTVLDAYGLVEPTMFSRKAHLQPFLNLNPSFFFVSLSSRPWSEIIMDYSTCCLSVASEKLPALSAIAQVYHRETGKEYLAGLWREDLPVVLCWFAVPDKNRGTKRDNHPNIEFFFHDSPKGAVRLSSALLVLGIHQRRRVCTSRC